MTGDDFAVEPVTETETPHGRMPTLDDVARRAGVSTGTVSNYFHHPEHLSAETKDRVGRTLAELGYEANRSARALAMRGKSAGPTIRDVAREAGVSYQTVSRAINHPEIVGERIRCRVDAAIATVGFEPNADARALRAQSDPSVR